MFQIRYRDAMGRIGEFEVRGRKLETPAVLPVINPRIQKIPPREIREMGFAGVITNSYIIHKNEELREKALKEKLHSLLDFEGVVMTDSGSYQLYQYGRVAVGAKEIVEFQDAVGSDIGVILDIPTPPDAPREKAERGLEETLRRAKESLAAKHDMLLAGTVQGSTHWDLREKSAKEMSALNFDLYPIGGVVPLMESYRFAELARAILHSKKFLPVEKPVHLFGAGHPMIFALAVALGCDIFDSAAYALYAKDSRYITCEGTLRLEDIYEFPCSCEVCANYNPNELGKDEGREALLSKHNLLATLQEIKRVKQAIKDGSLWELVQARARAHPNLLEALKVALGYEFIERFDPVTKSSAFFYAGSESLLRPEVKRHLRQLHEIEFRQKSLVLLPEAEKPYSRTYCAASSEDYRLCIASPVFGVVPLEVEDIYPLNQHETPESIDSDQIAFMKAQVQEYAKGFEKVFVHEKLGFLKIKGERFKELTQFGSIEIRRKENAELKLKAMADYQFGRGAGAALFTGAEAEWAKTGKLRRAYSRGRLLATIRASDGFLILTPEGAEKLLALPEPRNHVVVHRDAAQFVRQGKSVFAKFVLSCDREIRPHQEVILVDEKDEFLATGRALLNAQEMPAFKQGVAVRVRHRAEE